MDILIYLTFFILGVGTVLSRQSFLKKRGEVRIVPMKGGCEELHSWTGFIVETEEGIRDMRKVCKICGFLGDGVSPKEEMLNVLGLRKLNESLKEMSDEEELMVEVWKRVNFDIDRYYDAWIAQNRTLMEELLKDVSRVDELHKLLNLFLVEGTRSVDYLKREATREIRDGRKDV